MTVEAASCGARTAGGEHALDRSVFLVCAAAEPVRFRKGEGSARLVLLGFSPALVDACVDAYARLGATRERLLRWLAAPALLPRTTWVHEIVHRYLFERYVLGNHLNDATRFLEVEILKEVYFLFRDRTEGGERASAARLHSGVVNRALEYVEGHVFDPVSVGRVAAHAGASESTLLRAFHRELGCTPAAYWRARKLDEAMVRLRSGGRSVAEVALEVGYENPTAFGYAFRRRFGRPPRGFRPARPLRPAP